ncbi:NAD(P)H-dependent oxidoreductase [Gallaecimonas kandeliae]|uniref:NADPH-dependent FMN reductase n=1 Tax=Gallaecimonas kandeliae TaxID=3029055 RepID=UPI0026475407|nr:NADPH-dependent FMN reductase [Gallaecimonas kandeliae]WKE64047.1 NAD(P)H-dependent oxidoreductase [Gallaecimonas kandeliae]
MERCNLLALSGSLRRLSYNRTALEALRALSPSGISIELGDIGALPLFNPDLEDSPIPALAALKSALARADGLIIASPEYAHGISGPMKNALDWLVSGEEFPGKPIMLVNTSPRASHAQAALREVLVTMSGIIIDSACLSLPLLGSGLARDGILANPALAGSLQAGLIEFCRQIRALQQATLAQGAAVEEQSRCVIG